MNLFENKIGRLGKIQCSFCEATHARNIAKFTQPRTDLRFYLEPEVELSKKLFWFFSRKERVTMSPQMYQTWQTELERGAEYWTSQFNIKAEVVDNIKDANWFVEFAPIDGPGRTLAWNTLPPGAAHMRLDPTERWIRNRTSGSWNTIIGHEVMAHEIGHGLGLGHGGSGLMAAAYKGIYSELHQDDIELLERIGYQLR